MKIGKMPLVTEPNKQRHTTLINCISEVKSFETIEQMFFLLKYSKSAECIWQYFFHIKQDCKQKRWTTSGRTNENIPRSILQNIQSILEGLKNFISLVYTVCVVGKELGSMIFQPLLNLTPMPKFLWKR